MAEITPIDPNTISTAGVELVDSDDVDCPLGCVLVEIPNGLKVAVGEPPVATYNLLGDIFADQEKPSSLALAMAKVCFYVQAINGVPQARPTNRVELQVLQNKLLDSGLDNISTAINEYFPQPTKDNLKVLKKNLRR